MVLEKTLKSPLDCKEIKPVNPEVINPEYPLEGRMLKLKLENFGHLMRRSNSLEEILILGKTEGRRRGRQRMRRLDGITGSTDMSMNKLREMVKSCGVAEPVTTEQQNNNTSVKPSSQRYHHLQKLPPPSLLSFCDTTLLAKSQVYNVALLSTGLRLGKPLERTLRA